MLDLNKNNFKMSLILDTKDTIKRQKTSIRKNTPIEHWIKPTRKYKSKRRKYQDNEHKKDISDGQKE